MSHIEELLHELCPDGVEYRELQEIFNTRNGYTPSKKNPEYWAEGGTVPWFRMEDIRESGRLLETPLQYVSESAVKRNGLMPKGSLIVATSATIGEHAMLMVDGLCNQRFTCLIVRPEYAGSILEKYVFYWGDVLDSFCKVNLNQGNFASVNMDAFNKFPFPLPPIEVQQEIVRILDAFSELEDNLQRELDARKRQYEHYRDEMLAFDDDIMRKRLGEVALQGKKGTLKQEELVEGGQYAVVNSGCGYYGYYNKCNNDGECITIASRGEYAGFIRYESDAFWAGGLCYPYHVADKATILPAFLYYWLKNTEPTIRAKLVSRGSIPALNRKDADNIVVPIPPFEIQQDIVAKLEVMVDIQKNLQRQIDLTHRQYEHYRNMLLDLPKKVA